MIRPMLGICSFVLYAFFLFFMAPSVTTADSGVTSSFTVPLTISNISASSIGNSYVTIRWDTNGNATSQVFYDTKPHENVTDYAHHKEDLSNLVIHHSITLTGLFPSTTYHYIVKSSATVGGSTFTSISPGYFFRTLASSEGPWEPPAPVLTVTPAPAPTPVITPTLTPEPTPVLTPAPTLKPEVVESVIGEIYIHQQPVAFDTAGNPLVLTGNFITLSQANARLTVNIPVALREGAVLQSFTDAAGLTFRNNTLEIPERSLILAGKSMLRIVDNHGDLGTTLIIKTTDAVGTGNKGVADVNSIRARSGFTVKDFSIDNPSLGEIASSVCLEFITLPDGAKVKITTSLEPGPEASAAFQIAAANAGYGKISIAYVINVDKTKLENTEYIRCANITMIAGRKWVEANGGTEAIRIIRYEAETGQKQVLQTAFAGYDDKGRAIFEGYSPDGLSVFGLVGTRVITPVQEPAEPLTHNVKLWILLISGVAIVLVAILYIFIRRKRNSGKHT